jgi:hypothetical protein
VAKIRALRLLDEACAVCQKTCPLRLSAPVRPKMLTAVGI